ncbi:response regulator [Pollutibacter soli]|uniref:response regulator n=1 Tax=Pollutibacter soli TaxID=3034157 RepID=UPI0030134FFA
MLPREFSVILIDESEVIGSRLNSMFAGLSGYRLAAHAHTISEGYLLCKKFNPDVVLLDSWLPDGTGMSMLKELKEKFPSQKIIILSNSGNQYYKEKCLELGADWVMDKSTELPELVEIFSNLTGKTER